MPTNKTNDDSMRNTDKSSQQSSQGSQQHLRDKDDKMDKGKSSPGASSDEQNKSGYDKSR